jgi:mannose-6-phosphate isomerase class I
MIYFVIPQLIEQPTWGGSYIGDSKGISKYLETKKIKVGQSYEFFSGSYVAPAKDLEKTKAEKIPFFIKRSDVKKPELINKLKSIKELSKTDLKSIFGKSRIPDFLVKFTQAKGNSFQIHPGRKTTKYKPKPESWYFFEKGRATLGLKPNIDLELYKATLEHIYEKTAELSKAVKKKKMKIDQARKEMKSIIEIGQPLNFVNYVKLDTNHVVENYMGGVHHSWEEDEVEIPNGNIVYEVQLDVADEESTIRGYDKGKLMDDGSYREVDIENYFKYIDTSGLYNDPTRFIKKPIILKETASYSLKKIFDCPYYQMDELNVFKTYDVEDLGFRHLFVRSGEGTLQTESEKITLRKGWSYLLTPDIKKINIKKSRSSKDFFKMIFTYMPRSITD